MLGINFKFHFQSSFLLSFCCCCFFFSSLLLKLFVGPPLWAWQRTPFGICKAKLSKYPAKATNIFPTGCNIFSRLPVVVALLVVVVIAFYFHMPRGSYCHSLCLPPTPDTRLPACLLHLRLILRALALIILIIIPIYARKYLRFTAYFSLDSSRFCFVLPFLPTSLSRSPSLPLVLPLSCSFSSFYLTRNATSRNENV